MTAATAAIAVASLGLLHELALESRDLDAIRDLLDPGARWGAPEGPHETDCQNRDQVIAWRACMRAPPASGRWSRS